MKEGHVLKSTKNVDYISSQASIAEQKTERFLLHLKNQYDYDEVVLYTYNYIDEQTDISIINSAIDFIFSAYKLLPEQTAKDEFKLALFKSSRSIQLIRLTRSYSRHLEYHYLFISTRFDDDEFKITIPVEFNYSSLLQIQLIALNSSNVSLPLPHHYQYYQSYEDSHHYYEFKEKNELGYFESIFEINVPFDDIAPVLKIVAKKNVDIFSVKRKAQILIKYYPTDLKFYSTFNMEMTIFKGKEIIKHSVIENARNYRVQDILNEFIFPLAEESESLTDWDIQPELTAKFMATDFKPYWLLKDMRDI